jgi:integrase
MASIQKTATGYRARYRDGSKKEHLKRFKLKKDAQQWLDAEQAKMQHGTWVAPRDARITIAQWCTTWLRAFGNRKPSTVRQAQVHIDKITEAFGDRRLVSLRPLEIRSWLVGLKEGGYSDSYIYALHARLSQILSDAVHDGILGRSPTSRRTAPRMGRPRPYVASTEQIWALHDAMEERYRAGLLLAAFAGLRLAEVCGLRVSDVDFMRGIVHPVVQYPAEELKTDTSRTPVPIPRTWCSSCPGTSRSSPLSGSCAMRRAGRWGRGSYSGRAGPSGAKSQDCQRGLGSTTCGTITRRC